MKNQWSTTVSDWQGVDDAPTAGSDNLVKSGGVAEFMEFQNYENDSIGAWDTTPMSCLYSLKAGEQYRLYVKSDELISEASVSIGFYTYNNGYTQISQFTPAEVKDGVSSYYTADADCALYFRTTQKGIHFGVKVFMYGERGLQDTLNKKIEGTAKNIEDIIPSIPNTFTMKQRTPITTGLKMRANIKYLIYVKASNSFTPDDPVYTGLWIGGDGVTLSQIKTLTIAQFTAGYYTYYTPSVDCVLYVRTTDSNTFVTITASAMSSLALEDIINEYCKYTEEKEITINSIYPNPTGFELKAGVKYEIYVKSDSFTPPAGEESSVGLWIRTGTWTQIKQLTPTEMQAGYTYTYTPQTDCRLDVRTYVVGVDIVTSLTYTLREQVSELSYGGKVGMVSEWGGKNVVVYGDSITAQGNGDTPTVESFMYWAYLYHKFASLHTRGVGGQTYIWNKSGWYCATDGNGNYLDRYKYDAQGNRLNQYVSPETITQEEIDNIEAKYGKTISVHYGAFCSWDRITTMIPSSIKDTIDLIVLCGGTNDFASVEEVEVEGDMSAAEPDWIANNATDPTWANDTTYYKGGDYDITTLSGAIASTIMKMQTWCPNAVVVLATPFPWFDLTTKEQKVNSSNLKFRRLCEIEEEIAGYAGTDVIDANGKCGINGVNFSSYQLDGVHPNADGRKMYGKVFVGELIRIGSMI